MNTFRAARASKGQIKCFHCRTSIRSRDGDWHEVQLKQVFLCKPCDRDRAPKSVPAFAIFSVNARL